MAERELAILVTARDLASKNLKGINKELGKMGSIAQRGVGTALKNIGKLAVVGAGLAVVLGVGAVKAAADFESQLNTINTVARATPAQLDAIGAGIRKIARDTGTPLEELTQGFYDLVSAGIAADQSQRVLASSNRLAIGGLASAAEGVDLLTTALNSYGISADRQGQESERFADIFAKSIERGKVTAAELAASFSQIGGLAAANGIEIEELAASYAQLTAKGVPAAEAATGIRSALVALIRRTGDLEKLEKKTGKSYLAIAGKQGLVAALEQLRIDSAKTGKPLIDFLGRVEGLGFAVNTTGENFAGYNENLRAMQNANGTAAAQMSERQQGLNFQLARLKALARDAGITIGSKLLPKLTPLAERLVAFLEENQPEIERFGDQLAEGFDKAAEFAKDIPWEAIGSGLKTAAQWSGELFKLFATMPPEVQASIVALAGLNKLSGGAVGSLVGELGKGLIKGVLGMTAGVVNIRAGVVTGGGVGAGGIGVAAGKGGIGTLGKVLIAAESIALLGTVIATQQQVAAQTAAHTAEVTDTGRDFLKSSPTIVELNRSIAGIDKGIADLQALPLGFLAGADKSVAELQGLRADFAKRRDAAFRQPGKISNEVNIKVPVTVNTEVNVAGSQRVTYLSSRASRTATKTQDTTISNIGSYGDFAGFDFGGMNY